MPEVLATRVTPQEPQEEAKSAPAGVVTETTPESTDIPLEALTKPYVVDLLEMGEAYGHFEMEKLSKEIDEGIKAELAYKEIKLTKQAYKDLVDSYLKKLDLPSDTTVYAQTEKLHKLVGINRILLETMKEKQEFLAMNPADMSSTQLKRYIATNL